jgi:hypothetical protein
MKRLSREVTLALTVFGPQPARPIAPLDLMTACHRDQRKNDRNIQRERSRYRRWAEHDHVVPFDIRHFDPLKISRYIVQGIHGE